MRTVWILSDTLQKEIELKNVAKLQSECLSDDASFMIPSYIMISRVYDEAVYNSCCLYDDSIHYYDDRVYMVCALYKELE